MASCERSIGSVREVVENFKKDEEAVNQVKAEIKKIDERLSSFSKEAIEWLFERSDKLIIFSFKKPDQYGITWPKDVIRLVEIIHHANNLFGTLMFLEARCFNGDGGEINTLFGEFNKILQEGGGLSHPVLLPYYDRDTGKLGYEYYWMAYAAVRGKRLGVELGDNKRYQRALKLGLEVGALDWFKEGGK